MKKSYIIILLVASLFVHFLYLGHPNEVVFDEVHYGKHVSDYFSRTFHFDGHPPLGRMSVAGFAGLLNYKPGFSFEEIGNKYPNNEYLKLRILPALAGAILPLIIYLILLQLGVSSFASFIGALLIILENGLLTQSHMLLMDPFLLLYGFASFLFYLKFKNNKKYYYLILTGIFAGAAFSVKWVGLSFVALPILLEGIDVIASSIKYKVLSISRKTLLVLATLLIVPFIVYFSTVMAYSFILNKSGTGDAFMSPEYQKTLKGNLYENDSNIKASNIPLRFAELNLRMYEVNQGLTADHPYSSQWYTWPFMIRPIYYWVETDNAAMTDSRIYFMGNPLIWWLSTLGILTALLWFKSNKIVQVLLAGYILNLLPFVGIKRVMFLYHYLSALIFAILILVYLIDIYKYSKKLLIGLVLACLVGFIYFAPLTYGLPLSAKAYEAKVWLKSWR